MRTPSAPAATGAARADIDESLQRLEHHLDDLQASLSARDLPGIEQHAAALQRALSQAATRITRAARSAQPPLVLRRRLGEASVRVAAQRDALARATATLERAMHLLMPPADSTLYSASGATQHLRNASSLQA
ncbi:MAG TPA: hypothetical protein VFK10_08230 [Burkholderiaceae bacterium]|nr:hypothetical protein [Burkholderiaceae bacterium]